MLAATLYSLCLLNVTADTIDDATPATGDDCRKLPHETALHSELGSVGFMKNIAEHPESIRVIAEQLLTKAVQTNEFKEPPDCAHTCAGGLHSQVVYRVEPTVFLPEEKQQAVCLNFEEQTKSDPMRFASRDFASVEKLNEWLMAFTQGRGDDGKALYERCSANCSPRYTFHIAKDGEKLTVGADVLCGLARDRKSDQYLVSTAIRWSCLDN